MALFDKKKKAGGCSGCSSANIVAMVVYLLTTVAAGVGVYKAHMLMAGATFGTSNGSLSLIAFAISISLLHKACKKCCGCGCELPKK